MDGTDWLRLTNFTLGVVDGVMIVTFVHYLRSLYGPKRGTDNLRYVAARLGTFTLLLVTVALMAEGFANLRHVGNFDELFPTTVVSQIVRFVVFACLTAVFIAMLAWHLMIGERNHRGKWPRLDRFMDRLVYRKKED